MTEQSTEGAGPAAEPPESPKGKAKLTEYHVLKLASSSGADETYAVVARNVKAAGGPDAVRRAVTPTETPQSFIAIPSRSFKLHTVRLEMKQRTVIE